MTGALLGTLAIFLTSMIVGALSFIVWRFHPHPVTRWLPSIAALTYYIMNFHIPAPAVVALQNHSNYPVGDALRLLSFVPAIGVGVFLIVRLFLKARTGRP